jgi:hypothetical protein
MVCLHCGKKLSVVKKLTTGEFCSAAHKKAYLLEQERFALARLLENQKRIGGGSQDNAPQDSSPANAGQKEQNLEPKREAAKQPKRRKSSDVPVEAGYLEEKVRPQRAAPILAIPQGAAMAAAKADVAPQLPELASAPVPAALEAEPEPPAQYPAQAVAAASHPAIAVEEKYGYDAFFSLLSRTSVQDEPLARISSPSARAANDAGNPMAVLAPSPSAFTMAPNLVERSGAQRAIPELFPEGELAAPLETLMAPVATVPPSTLPSPADSPFAVLGPVLPAAAGLTFAFRVASATDLLPSPYGLQAPSRLAAVGVPGDGAQLKAFPQLPAIDVAAASPAVSLPHPSGPWRECSIQPAADSDLLPCPLLEIHSVPAKAPRKPYSFVPQAEVFPPSRPLQNAPGRASALASALGRLNAPQPRREIRLVALEFDFTKGKAPTRKLRANSETGFGKQHLLLPVHKAKIKLLPEHQSVFSALGQLTGGSAEFSWRGLKTRWSRVPNDLRWIAMAIPIVIGLIWYSSLPSGSATRPKNIAGAEAGGTLARFEALPVNSPAAGAAASANKEPGLLSRLVSDSSMDELKRSIQQRAAVELADDFRQGLAEWSGVGDWASGWRYDRAGFIRPRNLALFTPSLELSDYRFEFLGQIESKALSWIFRAADVRNYYVNRLEIVEPGPLPRVVLVRYAVINGKAGPRTVTRLPMQVQMDTLYRVRVEVSGDDFVTTIQGQVVDVFSDARIRQGGVGFFAQPGEDVRLRWVEVSHQYDFLGKLCAFLVPYDVSAGGGRNPGQ